MTRQFEIPEPYIFSLDTPLISYNGRLLQASGQSDTEDNFIEFYKNRYSLEEIESPKRLESLYMKHNNPRFQEFKRGFIKKHLDKELETKDLLEQELKDNKVLSVIVRSILPVITNDDVEDKIGRALSIVLSDDDETERLDTPEDVLEDLQVSAEAEKIKRNLISVVEQEYAHLPSAVRLTEAEEDVLDARIIRALGNSGLEARFTPKDDGSLFNSYLVQGAPLMMVDNKLYDLFMIGEFVEIFKDKIEPKFYKRLENAASLKTPEELSDMIERNRQHIEHKAISRMQNKLMTSMLRIDGRYLVPIFCEKNDALKTAYEELIERQIKIDAVNENAAQTRILAKLATEKAKLEYIANQEDYQKNGAGFERHGSQYYVFVTTPKYALKSPHDKKYYLFPEAKIGVKIYPSGNSICVSAPIIMNRYEHPALHTDEAMQTICLGAFSADGAKRGKEPAEAVKAMLDIGKKTMMMGYRDGGERSGGRPWR